MYSPLNDNHLRIVTVLKKLDGYTQSTLIQCDDGRLYVAKLRPNPWSSNSLANEAIGSGLLSALEIPTPTWRVLSVARADIVRFPQLRFVVKSGTREAEPGLHFASQYLADVGHTITDFSGLPSQIPVVNYLKFLDMYLFDLWTDHRDRRQYIYRTERGGGFLHVFFIDNSHLFGNHSWGGEVEEEHQSCDMWTKPLTHTYDARLSRGVQRFRRKVPEVLHEILANVPSEWHGSDIHRLEEWLLERLDMLRELVERNLDFHNVGSNQSRRLKLRTP